jgi:hypothetical protein
MRGALSSCQAVGDYENASRDYLSLAEHWNGSKWAVQHARNPSGGQYIALFEVSCASPSCEAVGNYFDSSHRWRPLAERWNGSKWTRQYPRDPSGGRSIALSGLSCASGESCEAVGYRFNSSGTEVPLAEWWNGSNWSLQTIT